MNVDTAKGRDLDLIATTNYAMHRRPGETDDHFRQRIQNRIRGQSFKVGPVVLADSDHVRRFAELLHSVRAGHHKLREALEVIIRAENFGNYGNSIEQELYDLGYALKELGLIHDGKLLLPSGQRTHAWVDVDAVDTWMAATLLVMDGE